MLYIKFPWVQWQIKNPERRYIILDHKITSLILIYWYQHRAKVYTISNILWQHSHSKHCIAWECCYLFTASIIRDHKQGPFSCEGSGYTWIPRYFIWLLSDINRNKNTLFSSQVNVACLQKNPMQGVGKTPITLATKSS